MKKNNDKHKKESCHIKELQKHDHHHCRILLHINRIHIHKEFCLYKNSVVGCFNLY